MNSNIDIKNYTDEQLQSMLTLAKSEIQARRKEQIVSFLNDLKAFASENGTTVDDLMALAGYTKGKVKKKRAVRFVNPENKAETWTGLGKRPIWLNKKLEQGCDIESFRIA